MTTDESCERNVRRRFAKHGLRLKRLKHSSADPAAPHHEYRVYSADEGELLFRCYYSGLAGVNAFSSCLGRAWNLQDALRTFESIEIQHRQWFDRPWKEQWELLAEAMPGGSFGAGLRRRSWKAGRWLC